jgi:hypothetical protein
MKRRTTTCERVRKASRPSLKPTPHGFLANSVLTMTAAVLVGACHGQGGPPTAPSGSSPVVATYIFNADFDRFAIGFEQIAAARPDRPTARRSS